MEQDAPADCDIDRTNLGGDRVDRPVNHARLGGERPVTEPISVVEFADEVSALGDVAPRVDACEGHGVPVMLRGQVVGDHFRAPALHVEREEAAGRADVQHALAHEGDVPQVAADACSEVPLALDETVARNIYGVIERTVTYVGDQ